MKRFTEFIGLLSGFMLIHPTSGWAQEDSEPDAPAERLFMPALDMGVMLYSNPSLSPGFVIRTILDYRVMLPGEPFLRINLDTSATRFAEPAQGDQPGFSSPTNLNDLIIGGGVRFGNGELRLLAAVQAGVAIYGIPAIEEGDSDPEEDDSDFFSLETTTRLAGAARGAFALEWYFEPDAAVTVEVLGQRYWGQEEWSGADGWAGGLMLGVTAAL